MRITQFLEHFYPNEDEPIYGRVVRAKGTNVIPPAVSVPFTRRSLATDKDLQAALKRWNKTHGVFFGVNAGGKSDEDIVRINAVFAEIDDIPIQEQLDIYEFGPLTPSLQVVTKKSVHSYWLLEEAITPGEFTTIQKGLIQHFKSDEKIFNPSRIMRVPFFNHVSKPDDYEYHPIVVWSAPGFRYTYGELFDAFPYVAPKPKKYPKLLVSKNNANDELRERIMASPEYHVKGQFGYTRGICHDGVGDSGIFVHLQTGAVKCFREECSWFDICRAFGVEVRR